MKSKKISIATKLATVVCTALLIASCGGNSGDSKTDDPNENATTSASTSPDTGSTDTLKLSDFQKLIAAANSMKNVDPSNPADFQQFIEGTNNVKEADPSKTYSEHEWQVNAMIELSNGHIASADAKHLVHIWDPEDTSTTIATYTGHTEEVTSLIELSDGRIASGSQDSTIQLWDPAKPDVTEVTYKPIEHGVVNSMVELPDGTIAASFDQNGTVRIWDPTKPDTTLATYTGHKYTVDSVVLLTEGRIASSRDCLLHIWNPNTLESSHTGVGFDNRVHHKHSGRLFMLRDGRMVCGGEPSVILNPANPDKILATFEQHTFPMAMVQLSDGRIVSGDSSVAAGGGGRLYVWNPDNIDERVEHSRQGAVTAMLALSDGRLAVAGGSFLNPFVRIWNPDEL